MKEHLHHLLHLLTSCLVAGFLLWVAVPPLRYAVAETPGRNVQDVAADGGLVLPDGSVVELRRGDLYRGVESSERITFTRVTLARTTWGEGRLSSPALLADGRLTAILEGGEGKKRVTMLPDGTWMTAWPEGPEPAFATGPDVPVLPSIVKPEMTTGYLVLYDVERSSSPELRQALQQGVAGVRLLDREAGTVLAELVPEDDGSLFLEVPADVPLGLELLDADGGVLASNTTPFWVRPNERRVCLGCHVDSRYAPPNARPVALTRDPVQVSREALP